MAASATKKVLRTPLKIAKRVVPFALIAYFFPYVTIVLVACGIVDFSRNRRSDWASINRYFFGNGMLTWAFSPLNLFSDLISTRNRYLYRLSDLPDDCQQEIQEVIGALKRNNVTDALKEKMSDKKRGMIFFKWYGKNIDTSIDAEEFHRSYKYVRTIGVSVFNANQSTSLHFGPLRLTLRVLYNLDPADSDDVFIDVLDQKHLWRDDPMFIFDDTLMHCSVNGSERIRYCMFVDIERPSRLGRPILHALLAVVQVFMINFRGIFYKNWEPIL